MRKLIAIDLPGGPDFVDVLLRCWDRRDAVLPIDQRLALPAKQLLLDSLAPHAIVTSDGETRLDGRLEMGDDDALVMATSGTTGDPKGVVLTHHALAASTAATLGRLRFDISCHRWLACLPLNHIGGMAVVTRAVLTGAHLDVLAGFDLDTVRASSGSEVFVSLVPTTLGRVGAGAFHTVVLGGSTPPSDLDANVVTTYGMTETGSGVVYDGVPLDGVEVKIDPRTSEISVRGPMLLRAYRYRTGDVDPVDSGGWFATGDAGHFEADGRLLVSGRLSEMIITGGENVWPAPVEAILRTHPTVADAAVASRPDPEWGERVVAFVVPAAGCEPKLEQLRELVKAQMSTFAAPRELHVVAAIPRTSIGKIRRHALVA